MKDLTDDIFSFSEKNDQEKNELLVKIFENLSQGSKLSFFIIMSKNQLLLKNMTSTMNTTHGTTHSTMTT